MTYRAHTLTLIAGGLTLIVETYLLPPPPAVALATMVAVACVVLSARKVETLQRLGLVVIPLMLAAALVQFAGKPLQGEDVWFATAYTAFSVERMNQVLTTSARVVSLVSLGLVASSLSLPRLSQAMSDLRLPTSATRASLGALGFVTVAKESVRTVIDAATLQGLSVRGPLLGRILALPALAIPLMAVLFTEAAHRSAALERRGFQSYEGDLPTPRSISTVDRILMVAFLGIPIAQMVF